jgi:hypothetical protein
MFADVKTLLETSRPRPRLDWLAYMAVIAVVSMLAVPMLADRTGSTRETIESLLSMFFVLMIGGMTLNNYFQSRAVRAEMARLEAAEELVQLRRWPQAAMLLQSLLSRPTRSPLARLQALVCLCGVSARFHRFEDVLTITDNLLDELPLDAMGSHMVKLTRAMALLREDRLFDADRAISDLRRFPQASESAGLALVELYRDVKTGHPHEALELFEKKQETIRRQLGHRVADAFVLAAKAHDLLGQTEKAKSAYQSATLLSPMVELHRRYPETSDLSTKYTPAPPPAEVVG